MLGGYDPPRYESERLCAHGGRRHAAPDLARLPQGHAARRQRAVLLNGYGSYGYPATRSRSRRTRVSLLDRGVVFAIAHIRGGGEMGKRWHDEGRMLHKRNTFTDFIAAAEHLIAREYTSRDRLVIEGGSAGGLLMGAVVNMRPDLFRAVVLARAVRGRDQHDARRVAAADRRRVRGVGQPERCRSEYAYMKSLLPVHEPRSEGLSRDAGEDVVQRQPGDVLGARQVRGEAARSRHDAPLLLKTNMAAGHGGASGRYDYLREVALDYAFVLWTLRMA